jgi:hypothetical protein
MFESCQGREIFHFSKIFVQSVMGTMSSFDSGKLAGLRG